MHCCYLYTIFAHNGCFILVHLVQQDACCPYNRHVYLAFSSRLGMPLKRIRNVYSYGVFRFLLRLTLQLLKKKTVIGNRCLYI